MKFTDKLILDGEVRMTKDGYAIANARVARGGNVQIYRGYELGSDKETLRVYRPVDEVFKKDALATYAGVPVTVGHPDKMVTADNWKEHAVGESGEDVLRDGEYVRIPLMLRDAKAIKALGDGKRELSMGYTAELTMADGTTPDGQVFDAVMSNFKMNHVALCKTARGGSELRFGDDARPLGWGASPVRQKPTNDERKDIMETRKVMVDGLQVETTDAGAAAITKLQGDVAAAGQRLTDANAAHAKVLADKDADHVKVVAGKDAIIADKDKALAAKDAEIDALKGKVLSDVDLDKRVAARTTLLNSAAAIAKDAGKEVKLDGLSDAAIRKAVVAAVLGDETVKDKADAYIDARYEILAEDVAKKIKDNGGGTPNNVDPFNNVRQGGVVSTGDADKARMAYEEAERNAWRGGAKAA